MGLQIWLPLNGSIYNQGLDGDAITNSSGITYASIGKIGSQSLLSGSMTTSKNYLGYEGTICFWIYITENSNKGMLYGNSDTGASLYNRKWSLFLYPTRNDLHCWGCQKDSKNNSPNGHWQLNGVIPDNKWTHICITHNRSMQYIYINGIQVAHKEWDSSGDITFDVSTPLMKSDVGRYLQDYRIYDNCLSPKQVKEISKGLVCHYPLGEIDGKIGGRNLLVKTNQGKTKWVNAYANGSYSCESVNWNGINAVKMSCATPTTSWRMFMFNGLLENFDKLEPSAIYTLSYDVIGNIKVGFSNLWDSSAVNSIVEKSSMTILETSYGYHYTVDILLKNILTKSKQVVYLYNNLKAGESVIIANLKLEKGNKATAYTPCPTDDPVMYDNVIYDTSGYNNNGSVSGDILWDTNTPRYKGAYDFNGTGYIYNDNLNLITTAFTISFWIKIPSTITHQHFDFATFNGWTGEGIAIYWDTSGQTSSSGAIFGEDSNGNKIHVGVQCRGKLNEWTHFAITWDGTKVYRYSNGIKFSESDFNVVSVYHPRLWLGNSTFGDRILENSESCMSDFRFYATALSDSDILELYQSSASVDNNGNLMLAGEVIEE